MVISKVISGPGGGPEWLVPCLHLFSQLELRVEVGSW